MRRIYADNKDKEIIHEKQVESEDEEEDDDGEEEEEE